jgi:hypothetical protein
MTMETTITFSELDTEAVQLLPAKETLFWNHNWANVWASNSSMALNASTFFSNANSTALQSVTVTQG